MGVGAGSPAIAGGADLEATFAGDLGLTMRILHQDRRQRGPKDYALDAPEVE